MSAPSGIDKSEAAGRSDSAEAHGEEKTEQSRLELICHGELHQTPNDCEQ